MSRIRCFIAVPTPPDVLNRITEVIADLQSIPSDVKWEHAEKLHITLKFLGSVEENDVRLLVAKQAENLRGISSFDYSYEGVGAFPSLEHPRVYWIGTSKNSGLVQLHKMVEEVTHTFSIADDDRTFHPHVT